VRTLSTSLFSIVGEISSTWTVIKLSAATLLYAATLSRFGVSSSAPSGCLSRAMTRSARVCLSICDNDDGGRRDAASRGNVTVSLPNGRPRRATSRAAHVYGAANAMPEGPGNRGNSPIEEDRSSVASGFVSATLALPMDCQSRRKSIQGRTRYREPNREILLGLDIHNPDSCLCAENMSRLAPRSGWPEFEIEARKYHPLSYEQWYRKLMKSIIQPQE
jgi:hypothetical protein